MNSSAVLVSLCVIRIEICDSELEETTSESSHSYIVCVMFNTIIYHKINFNMSIYQYYNIYNLIYFYEVQIDNG